MCHQCVETSPLPSHSEMEKSVEQEEVLLGLRVHLREKLSYNFECSSSDDCSASIEESSVQDHASPLNLCQHLSLEAQSVMERQTMEVSSTSRNEEKQ